VPSRTAMVLGSRGDPGLFSVLKRVGRAAARIGSFITGGVAAAAPGAVAAVVPGNSGTRTARVTQIGLSNGRVASRATPQLARASFIPSIGAAGAVAGRVLARVSPATVRGAGKILAGGALFELGGLIFDAVTGEFVEKKKVRRMNVLNPRALSRATRRLSGFNKRSKNVEKQLRRLAPAARRRSTVSHFDHHDHHGHHS